MSVQSFSLALPDASPALALPLLSRWLARAELQAAVATASALLVQVHVAAATPARSAWLFTHLAEALPQALCVGCSAEQGIAGGQPVRDAAVVSLLCLGHSRLRLEIAAGQPGAEYPLGMALGDRLAAPDLRGLLVLALPGPLDAGRLAEGAHGRLAAEVVVFGGVAAQPRIDVSAESNASAADPSAAASDLPGPGAAWIHVDGRFHTGAVLAMVGFYGEALQMQQELLFAWKPIGPALTLDEVEGGFCVHRINAAPAAEVYQRLLRIEARNDEIYLLEFPLVVERRGVLLARNPVAMGEDGRVSFVATLRRGEQARLGYLDVDASVKAVDEARLRLQDFSPQALLLHSCVCRMHTLQQEIECETLPFQSLAETSGWYTHGEFGVQGGRVHLFNSTQSVVGLREGALPPASATIEASTAGARVAVPAPAPREPDPVRFRHAVITSRLLHSIGRLSEELEQANARLRHLSEHDALTGALNRRALEAQLQTELARSQRYGYALSLLMVDLDHFKRLNDSHGHTIGDLVLQHFVLAVRRDCLRASDAVYRYGGEEFVLLLPETPAEPARRVAERVRRAAQALELPLELDPYPEVSCSVGVAAWLPDRARSAADREDETLPSPLDAPDSRERDPARLADQLLKAADAALYEAKHLGRNQVRVAPT